MGLVNSPSRLPLVGKVGKLQGVLDMNEAIEMSEGLHKIWECKWSRDRFRFHLVAFGKQCCRNTFLQKHSSFLVLACSCGGSWHSSGFLILAFWSSYTCPLSASSVSKDHYSCDHGSSNPLNLGFTWIVELLSPTAASKAIAPLMVSSISF